MRKTMTAWALALAAGFTWTAAVADAQPSTPPGPRSQAGGIDKQIEDYVLVRLAEKAWVGGDFMVTANDGTATLTGTVPSESTKARIGRIARQTIGVREVRNDLRVNANAAEVRNPVNDAELAQRVARRIASEIPGAKTGEDWWLDGWRVEGPDNVWNFVVEAENGRVYLEGDVPRLSIVRRAVDAARQTSGVQSVRSDVEVDRLNRGDRFFPYGASPYHPYAYGPADLGAGADTASDTASTAGRESVQSPTSISGRVTSIDRERGRLTLQTDSGSMPIRVPSSALAGVQPGQQVTVQILVGGGAPSASPPSAQPDQKGTPR